MASMRIELLKFLARRIGKAIARGDAEAAAELSAWETFIQFTATESMIADYYCEYWDTHVARITVQPTAQLSMF